MEEVNIHTIIADHRSKERDDSAIDHGYSKKGNPNLLEIPAVFFDQILVDYKLTRIEIMVMIYIYRRVWCLPNLYRVHGISQLLSHTEMAKLLKVTIEEIHNALRKLEGYGFIATIRSGQYFVRKYFSKENDELFEQEYDDFDI